jgi:hypothetical protein
VYRAAWRRRRIRQRLAAAVVAGATAAVVAVVAIVVTAGGGADRGAPDPAGSGASPSVLPTTVTNALPYGHDGTVHEAVATGAGHLYAIQFRCDSADLVSCRAVLYGSEDDGRTWTERNPGPIIQLDAPAPGVLSASFPVTVQKIVKRFSVDGGRTWKDWTDKSGTIPAVPTGGWAACPERDDVGACAVEGVDPVSGVQRKLASQPPGFVPARVLPTPAGSGLWLGGITTTSGHAGVAVSHDGGRTWLTQELGRDVPDYPAQTFNQAVTIATVDGTSAYAIASIVGADRHNLMLAYRTTDGGQTWSRADPGRTLPWVYTGEHAYLAADGTHIVQTVPSDPAEWYAGTGGAYTKPARVDGLGNLDDMRVTVRTAAPGVYYTHDVQAVYVSVDGLHWTRHPVVPVK